MVAAALVLTTVGVGCGDDDDDASKGDAAATEPTAYCGASRGLSNAFNREEPPTQEEVTPMFEALVANAPEDVVDDAEVAVSFAKEALGGDDEAFDDPAFVEALREVDGYAFEACEATKQRVTAVDYRFEGFDEELDAGSMIFRLQNDGDELHELALLQKDEGVTQPIAEILALGEEEAKAFLSDVGFAFIGGPGDVAHLYTYLEPGNYAAVCFLPVGATDFEALDRLGEDTPGHFSQGMATDFTVV
jgi:hypothetical protein